MERKRFFLGSVFCVLSAGLWGVSGTVGQYLFHYRGFQANWLVSTRMVFSGILLLLLLYIKNKKEIFHIWSEKRDGKELMLFSIFGMLGAQYTCYSAIAYSNAATATVLQFVAPVIIMLYLSIRLKIRPGLSELIAVTFAMAGIFLIATHGRIDSLAISPQGLFWGILSAFAMAYYSVQPKRLLEKFDSLVLIGWSMLIGGVVMSLFTPPWRIPGVMDRTSVIFLIYIVLFGTLIPFSFYLAGIHYIGATKASLFTSIEPVSAAIVSVVWLKVSLGVIDYVGFLLVILTVFLLAIPMPRKSNDTAVLQES